VPLILPTGIMKESSSQKGFTLLEVVAVLFLLTLIISLVWPEMDRSLTKMEFKAIIQQIHHDLCSMEDEAKGMNLPTQVEFSPGASQYTLNWGGQTLSRPLGGLVFAEEESVILTFTPSGVCEGPGMLKFENSQGQVVWIETGGEMNDETE
jgi:prepilin-type N-terminal cleavage/methylation domain-containing protein